MAQSYSSPLPAPAAVQAAAPAQTQYSAPAQAAPMIQSYSPAAAAPAIAQAAPAPVPTYGKIYYWIFELLEIYLTSHFYTFLLQQQLHRPKLFNRPTPHQQLPPSVILLKPHRRMVLRWPDQ